MPICATHFYSLLHNTNKPLPDGTMVIASPRHLQVTVDGKPDRLDCSTFCVEGTSLFLNWSSVKRLKTPQGEAFKFANNLVHCKDADKLERIISGSSSGDPLLDHLICFIQQQLQGSDVEGVFRVNGEAERVKVILRLGKVTSGSTIHDAASAIKQRLKELVVFTTEEQQTILSSQQPNQVLVVNNCKLFTAIHRLCRIIMANTSTKMTAENLAVCLAPSIFDMESVRTPDQIKAMTSVLATLLK